MKHSSNTVTEKVGLGLTLVFGGLAAFSVFACEGARASSIDAAEAKDSESQQATATTPETRKEAPETRKKAKVTPEIIAAGEKLLAERADAPLGSEFPMSVGGRRYTGRIEEHDNPEGKSGRPPGKHRGVTVYER